MKKQMWHKVRAPKPWRPTAGQELIGTYAGCKELNGIHGQYKQHYVKTGDNIVSLSGARCDQLFALINIDSEVKVVFNGMRKCANSEFSYKDFDVFTRKEVTVDLNIAEAS